MGRLVVIDGVSLAPERATVSVYDRGFLYGDSVFETIRTYRGKPYALKKHIRRLEKSASLLGIDMPLGVEPLVAEVEAAVLEADNPDSYVRVMLSRGVGPLGLDSQKADKPLRVILIEPLQIPPVEQYRDGIAVICVQTVRASDAAHSAKLGNYLASVLALRDARQRGAREALVVNRDGKVVEGTTSNLFIVRPASSAGGLQVVTPPLELGVLPGITRALVIELVPELGLELRCESLSPLQVLEAAEVFITSSIRELLPVVKVDDQLIADGRPGSVTRAIHRALRRRVGMGEQALPWDEPNG